MAIVVKKYFQIFYRKKIHLLIQLEGFGWSNLIGIDVNREHFCGAVIIHTATQQIDCLYRLEPK
jgi:hypothetical protein